MNAYLWTLDEGLTFNWHSGGSVLIIANSVSDARKLWNDTRLGQIKALDNVLPTSSWRLATDAKKRCEVLLFQDAGCC